MKRLILLTTILLLLFCGCTKGSPEFAEGSFIKSCQDYAWSPQNSGNVGFSMTFADEPVDAEFECLASCGRFHTANSDYTGGKITLKAGEMLMWDEKPSEDTAGCRDVAYIDVIMYESDRITGYAVVKITKDDINDTYSPEIIRQAELKSGSKEISEDKIRKLMEEDKLNALGSKKPENFKFFG